MTADESTGLASLSSPKTRSRNSLPEFAAQDLLPTSGEAKMTECSPRRMNGTGSCRLIEIVVMNESIVGKKRVLAMALRLEITTIIWMVIR
jgi:hypothetical protein